MKPAFLGEGLQESRVLVLLQQICLVQREIPTTKEEEVEEEPEKEQEEEEDSSSFKEEKEADNDEPEPSGSVT